MTQSTVALVDQNVTIGVDTHSDVHVAVALDQLGRRLGDIAVPTTPEGYRQLESWASQFGRVDAFGIEGTGSWGAGLVRQLRDHGYRLVEVNRPDRSAQKARFQAANQLRALLVTAPAELRGSCVRPRFPSWYGLQAGGAPAPARTPISSWQSTPRAVLPAATRT